MTLNCSKTNLKKGSKGNEVKELQTILQKQNYYTGKIDGDFGSITEESVKKFQKANKLTVDGWVGQVTCKKLQENTVTDSYYKNGLYHSGKHYVTKGCNKLGQCTKTFCADVSMKQQLTKNNLDSQFSQQLLASYAGTTSRGTSHAGIETALYKVAKQLNIKLEVTWKNFSDLGSNQSERFEALGKLISQQDVMVILHTLYKLAYGHYESVQEVNMNKKTVKMLNSLGSKCSSTAFCGYIETRDWNRLSRELAGISQKSVCIIKLER